MHFKVARFDFKLLLIESITNQLNNQKTGLKWLRQQKHHQTTKRLKIGY
jgi:hypothetical protein